MAAEKKQPWQRDDVLVAASHVQWVATNVFLVTVPPYKRRLSCELAAVGLPRTLKEGVLDVVEAVVARVNRSRRIFLRQDLYATFPLEGYGDVIFGDSITTGPQRNGLSGGDGSGGGDGAAMCGATDSPCGALYSLQETLLRVGAAAIIRPTIIRCAALLAAEAAGAREHGDVHTMTQMCVDDLHVSAPWLRRLREQEAGAAHTLWCRCRVVDVLRGDVYCVTWHDECSAGEAEETNKAGHRGGPLPTLLLLAAVTCHDEATASGAAALRWARAHVMHAELLVCVHSVERGDHDVALNTQITLYEQMDGVRGTAYDTSGGTDKAALDDRSIGLQLLRAGHGFVRRSIDAAAPRPRDFHVLLRAIDTAARATLGTRLLSAGADKAVTSVDLDALMSDQCGLSRRCLTDALHFHSVGDMGEEGSVWLRSACRRSARASPRAATTPVMCEATDLPQGYGGAGGLLGWAWRRYMWCGDICRDPAQEPRCVVYRPLGMLVPLRDLARYSIDLHGYISAVRLLHVTQPPLPPPASEPGTDAPGPQYFAAVDVMAVLADAAYRRLCRTIPSMRAADEIVYDPPPSAVACPAKQTVVSFYRADPTRTETAVQMKLVARFYEDRDALRGAMKLAADGEAQAGDSAAAAAGIEIVVTVQQKDASINLELHSTRKHGWFLVTTTVFTYDAQWGVFVKMLTSQAAYYLDREAGEGASWGADRDDGGSSNTHGNGNDAGGGRASNTNDNEAEEGGGTTTRAGPDAPVDVASKNYDKSELSHATAQTGAMPAELCYRFVLSFYFPLQCVGHIDGDVAGVSTQAALRRALCVQTQTWLYRDVCCLPVGVARVNGVRGLVGDVVLCPDGEPQSVGALLARAVTALGTSCVQRGDTMVPQTCATAVSWPMQDIAQRATALLQRRQHEWLRRDEAAARLALVRLAAVDYQAIWQHILTYRDGMPLTAPNSPQPPALAQPASMTRRAVPALHDLLIALARGTTEEGTEEGMNEKNGVAEDTPLAPSPSLPLLRLHAGFCPLWRDTHTLPSYPVLSPAVLPPSLPLFALAPFVRQFVGGNPIHHRKVVSKDDARDTAEAHMDWAFMRLRLPQLPSIFRVDLERLPVPLRNYERALCEAIMRDDPVTLCQSPHRESGPASVTADELLFAAEPTFSRLLALLFLLQCPTGATQQAKEPVQRSSLSSTAAMYDLLGRYCAPMEGEILTVQSANATLYRLPRRTENKAAAERVTSSAALPTPPAAGQAVLFLGRGHTATNESLALEDETQAEAASAVEDGIEDEVEERTLPFPLLATEARRVVAALAFETFTQTACCDGETNGADEASALLTSGRADKNCLMACKGLGPAALTQGTPLLYHPLPWLAVLAAPLVQRREATPDALVARATAPEPGCDAEVTRYIGLQYVPLLIGNPTSKMYKISSYGRFSRNFVYRQHIAALRAGEDVGAYLSLLLRRPLSRDADGKASPRFADGLLTFYGVALEALYAHYTPRRALRFKLGSIAPQLRRLLTQRARSDAAAEEDIIEQGEEDLLSGLCRAARKIMHVIDERFGGRATRVFLQMTAYVLSKELTQPFMRIALYAVPEEATLNARGGGGGESGVSADTKDGNDAVFSSATAASKRSSKPRRRHVHAAFATHRFVLDDGGEVAALRVTYDQAEGEFCCEWC